jgi:GH24 family phage-related lysozyme (muramidase)
MTAARKTPSYIIAASGDLVQRHQGRRQFPYYDTRGKLTIAVGRNLTDCGLGDDEIDYLFADDLIIALQIFQDLHPSFASFTPVRQAALVSMAFNRGKPRLAGFRRMHAAINRGNWQGGRLMKPKTAFGRVKHGTAPSILPPGFAACISLKNDLNRCPLSGADYGARIDWVLNFAVLLKTWRWRQVRR